MGIKCEITCDNIVTHGIAFAAKQLKRQNVPFAIAYWLIFGKAPRQLQTPPPSYCKLFARVTGRELPHLL